MSGEPEIKITFDVLWFVADSARVAAQANADANLRRFQEARENGDASAAAMYRAAHRQFAERALAFERMQIIAERMNKSDAIKAELGRLAREERAAQSAAFDEIEETADAD